jgi:hypothetical protein
MNTNNTDNLQGTREVPTASPVLTEEVEFVFGGPACPSLTRRFCHATYALSCGRRRMSGPSGHSTRGRSDHTSRAGRRTAHRPHDRSAVLPCVSAGQLRNIFFFREKSTHEHYSGNLARTRSRDSSVGIAISYGLDDRGGEFESR